MSVSQRIWQVGQPPRRLVESRLASEQELEEMIVAEPEIVSDEWMVIGRQEETGFGGRIDLLAIAPDSSLVLIELKRGTHASGGGGPGARLCHLGRGARR